MSTPAEVPRLQAEQRARVVIDRQLRAAGWAVQDRAEMNLFAGPGVAVRETIMATGHGRADFLLYVDQRAVGVIEAKPPGTPLSGVEWQSAVYAEGLPAAVRLKALTRDGRLPFVFEASGSETHVTNGYDPQPRAQRIFDLPDARSRGCRRRSPPLPWSSYTVRWRPIGIGLARRCGSELEGLQAPGEVTTG